ncbi:HAMP domain-containing sensor histidine kinase [Streptomyces sp. NPDC097619]|uniref:HAMP domain-containing sensor histidine kinase n=1 Tax=Streptomyces sp. NPDC097619 TaxID=3157228 RepID=UPI00331EFCF5
MRRATWGRGLRARFVVAFLLATAFGSLLTVVLTFRQAREATLDRTQSAAVRDLRTQLDSLAPDLPVPPSDQDLRNLTLQLDLAGGSRGWHTTAVYGDAAPVSATAAPDTPEVPRALREAVADGDRAAYQRLDRAGRAWLALAMPLVHGPDPTAGARTDPGDGTPEDDVDGTPHETPPPTERAAAPAAPTGITVYAVFPLDKEAADISALVRAAEVGVVPALLLAVIPALLAARRVLLPVRRLQHGAERVTAGELDTRLDVRGSDELAALTATFNEMAATLQRDDAELRRLEGNARRFAADVAHELRTPLAAMSAVTGVLDEDAASGQLPPDTAEAVTLVADETRKLTRMVEDLMEIARFDAGRAPLRDEETDLLTLLATTLRLRGWTGNPRILLDLPAVPLPVHADTRRIDVVLANLIGNALRHGGPPVTVRARAEGRYAVLTVSDTGPGIPEDALPHVFDRFYKADSARTRSEGSGLGLAIAAENVRLHGGTLTATNGPYGGALFTLGLPLFEAEDETAGETAGGDGGGDGNTDETEAEDRAGTPAPEDPS